MDLLIWVKAYKDLLVSGLRAKKDKVHEPPTTKLLSFISLELNWYIPTRCFLETRTRFQTKMGKVFQTKTAIKTIPFGAYIPIWLI